MDCSTQEGEGEEQTGRGGADRKERERADRKEREGADRMVREWSRQDGKGMEQTGRRGIITSILQSERNSQSQHQGTSLVPC